MIWRKSCGNDKAHAHTLHEPRKSDNPMGMTIEMFRVSLAASPQHKSMGALKCAHVRKFQILTQYIASVLHRDICIPCASWRIFLWFLLRPCGPSKAEYFGFPSFLIMLILSSLFSISKGQQNVCDMAEVLRERRLSVGFG